MSVKQAYLIRRELDGTMRTTVAASTKGAMQRFVADYAPPLGEEFGVKVRGAGSWEFFSVTKVGIRRLAG